MVTWKTFGIAALLLTRAISASGTESGLNADEFSGVVVQSDRVFVAGQPSQQGLANTAEIGIRTVVNLRTPEEMAALDFVESEVVEKLGMKYVLIPSGGPEHPYSKQTLDDFATVMQDSDGPVLLHCKSATRASHLWVAYLVKYKGVPLDEALDIGRSIHFGSVPVEGYLEGELEYRYTPEPK